MFKTIIAVVAFLILALIVQLYEQNQLRIRIARQQQEAQEAQEAHEAMKAQSDREARRLGIQPQSAPVMEDLAVGDFRVASGMPKEFHIPVDTSGMRDATVTGQFAVTGKNSGIEVYIFDGDNYTNWLYGNDSVALYDSGRRTSGEIRSRIEKSGTYFLIFQNKSSSTALDVHADIRLQFEKLTAATPGIPNS
jgi:hypothetical protein